MSAQSPGQVLEQAREALGMNRTGFAEFAGVSPRTLARWVDGTTTPDARTAGALLQRLATRDAGAARELAAAWGLVAAAPEPPRPPPPKPAERHELAEELWLAAHAADVSPRKLRAALARLLDVALRRGWTVAELAPLLAQLGPSG